jgi:Flp pilus assembly protein TadG
MRERQRPQRQTGAALVEFALVLPTLLVLVLTVTELGRALWHYKVLAQSVREAARYLSVQTPGAGLDQARNLVLYGSLSGKGAYQLSDLTAAQSVQVRWQRQDSLALVTVSVPGYPFDSLVTSWWGLPFGRITFGEISATVRAASCGSVC